MAESRALRDGMEATLNTRYSTLDVEGDNSLLIVAVKGEIGMPWRIKIVINDIQQLFKQASNSKLLHVYREANLAADWLSKLGHSTTGTWTNVDYGSADLRLIVNEDRIGRSLVRREA